jgi:hypothetical protein
VVLRSAVLAVIAPAAGDAAPPMDGDDTYQDDNGTSEIGDRNRTSHSRDASYGDEMCRLERRSETGPTLSLPTLPTRRTTAGGIWGPIVDTVEEEPTG